MPLPHILWKYEEKVKNLKEHFRKHEGIKEYQAHSSKVHSVRWNCEGNYLASGSFDKTVAVFNFANDKLMKDITFRGHTGSVDQLCWHCTNPNLCSTASVDKTVRVWDARHHKPVATINTKGENINICWSPNGNTIGVGNKEDLITFIDTRGFKISREHQFNYEVNEIAWNKNSDLFFLTTGSGGFIILSYPDLEVQHSVKGHSGACVCIDFDPTGCYFAVGSADALVSLWDLEELCCVNTFWRLDWPVRTVSFSYDGNLLASGSEDSAIDIAEVESGLKVADVPVESATFTLSWHPKIYLLAYACDKKDVGCLKVYGFPTSSDKL